MGDLHHLRGSPQLRSMEMPSGRWGFWISPDSLAIWLDVLWEKANKSDHLADYLDLTFIIDSGGKLSTRLYDKRNDFDFHIVNFPYLSSNIPSGPSYGVYISELIRYARCCSHYEDFRYRHKCLVDQLLSQGYKTLRLEKSFKKFYARYQVSDILLQNPRMPICYKAAAIGQSLVPGQEVKAHKPGKNDLKSWWRM